MISCVLLNSYSAQSQRLTATNFPDKDEALIDSLVALPLDTIRYWLKDNYVDNLTEFYDVSQFALSELKQMQNDSLIGDCYLDIAGWFAYQGEHPVDSIIYNQKKAIEYFEKVDASDLVYSAKMNLAIDYLNVGKITLSQNELFEALSYYKQSDREDKIAECHRILSLIAEEENNNEDAIKYGKLASDYFLETEDYLGAGLSYFTMMKAYNELDQHQEALKLANEALDYAHNKIDDEPFFTTRAYEYRGDIYLQMEQYDKALDDLKQAHDLMVAEVGEERARPGLLTIGQALCKSGELIEGIEKFEAGLDAFDFKGEAMVKDMYKELAECYQNAGNYNKAYENLQTFERLETEALQNTIENLKQEAAIKYDTELKNETLALQEAEIAQKTKIQYLYLSIAALLGLLLFLLAQGFLKNKQKNELLTKRNQENELLLKEIHHRVKNNLQTVTSLLNLQSASIKDSNALDAVQESKNRVASMAMIHQKLYQGENLAAIEMKDYFETIGNNIIDSYGSIGGSVAVKVDMSEVELDVDTAVPIGLITNELLTNSMKYAFENKEQGMLSISLDKSDTGTYKLIVKDNGAGYDIDKSSQEGFGTMLVQLLTKQLNGTIKKETKDGVATVIEFKAQKKSAG